MSRPARRAKLLALVAVAAAAAAACRVPAARYPSDVQTALARHAMRRMETEQLLVYYPAGRRALAERMAAQIERCAGEVRRKARIDNRHSREKMVVVVPEAPFNNAYVLPPVGGLEDVAVIPAGNTLDFATTFGLPPDPGRVGCHEIVHYAQMKQIAGLWGALRTVLGELATPQVGFDAWFLEGLATYYEARLQPGSGRPSWPVFTSMFHAAYAGGTVGGSDLSELARDVPIGHHYLVGAMFVQFLAETYGEPALWRVIELQARSTSIILSVDSRFGETYGKGVGDLLAEFRGWTAARFPVRARPPGEQVIRALGDDARWAWGPGGEVAVIDQDVDAPARLRVWDASGRLVDRIGLVDLVPPRRQVIAAPLLVSGMSFADDGALWFTSIDLAGTFQTTRLYRWRRGEGLDEIASGLGPGGAVSPDGQRYFHAQVDGDRWSLAVRERGASKVLWNAAPGQYALRVQPSRDGARLAVSVWDGARFVVWVIDAASGARLAEHAGAHGPVFDGAWTDDGRLVLLDTIDGRFQATLVDAAGTRTVVTDAPYGALEARARGGTLRFLARDGLRYTLDEIALPAPLPAPAPPPALAPAPPIALSDPERAKRVEGESKGAPPLRVVDDRPYSRFDNLFRPTLHTFALVAPAVGSTQLGLVLSGGDRLDLVRWAAAGYVDLGDTSKYSGAGGLLLNDLAPWIISVTGQRYHFTQTVYDDTGTVPTHLDRETRDASLLVGRQYRGTYSLAAGGTYAYDRTDDTTLRLWGPEAVLGYTAIEATRASGIRRGIALVANGAYFPRRSVAIKDARAELDVWAPLPFTRRHVLSAALRGHAVLDATAPLIAVGGESALPPVWSRPDELPEVDVGAGLLPGQRRFTELLRGFEDYPLVAERVALADLAWSYPLVVDRGVPYLSFLPGIFLRELELELFAGACYIRPGPAADSRHAAAGAALTLHVSFFRAPLAVQYQVSRRLTDDEGVLHLIGFGPDS